MLLFILKAAWGGGVLVSNKYRHLMKGVERLKTSELK